jgi:hypothetical protein
MDTIIRSELDKIEKENDVNILYAVESGSRVWGLLRLIVITM